MKLKTIVSSLCLLGLSGAVFAQGGTSYYPPERINCTINSSYKLNCEQFNRQYLAEDTYTADIPANQEEMFNFVSAVAYFTPDQTESSVFFTYHNAKGKMAKLKTVSYAIRPDFQNGSWRKVNDYYVCDTGYMHCAITNLPEA